MAVNFPHPIEYVDEIDAVVIPGQYIPRYARGGLMPKPAPEVEVTAIEIPMSAVVNMRIESGVLWVEVADKNKIRGTQVDDPNYIGRDELMDQLKKRRDDYKRKAEIHAERGSYATAAWCANAQGTLDSLMGAIKRDEIDRI
jgi:methyl coenzyme M reductase subunit D